MIGNSHTIIRWVDAWLGSALRTCTMRCCTNMVMPENTTRARPSTLRSRDGSMARSMPRNSRCTGTAASSMGSHE